MISIDLNNSNIHAVEVSRGGNNLSVKRFMSLSVKQTILSQDNQLSREALKDSLQKIFSEFSSGEVIITFSSLNVVSNEYVFPFVKDKHQRYEMIKSKVFQTLPIDDYVMDYRITKTFKEGNNTNCNIVTYVAPRALVQHTYNVIKDLGKTPKSFNITQNSILNFANAYLKEQRIIIANISQNQALLHLINRPDAIITRSIAFEENQSAEADMFGLPQAVSKNAYDEVLDQISKLNQYQSIKYTGSSLEKLYLTGSMADDDVARFLRDNLNIEISMLSGMESRFANNNLPVRNFVYAIGAAL